jgi:hypothetical protein
MLSIELAELGKLENSPSTAQYRNAASSNFRATDGWGRAAVMWLSIVRVHCPPLTPGRCEPSADFRRTGRNEAKTVNQDGAHIGRGSLSRLAGIRPANFFA